MELSVLATWVDIDGKRGKKSFIDYSSGKRLVEHFRIDAGDHRLESQFDKFSDEARGVALPHRKQPTHFVSGEKLLTIRSDVFQKEIAKRYRIYSLLAVI